MRPPKPRCGLHKGSDTQPPHRRSSDLIMDSRICKSPSKPESVFKCGNLQSPAASEALIKALLTSRLVPAMGGDSNKTNHIHQASSSSATVEKMVRCGICMMYKPLHKFISIKGCKHSYCSRCLGTYVEAKVKMNVTKIGCPEPACKDGKLEPLTCKAMITKKVFDQWCDALCESTVGKTFYCPFKDCSAPLIDERSQDVLKESECPHCHRLFCVSCRVPWHAGLSCMKFQEKAKLGKEQQHDKMLMKLAKERRWQRCPKCKFIVERISGCLFIKCRCGSTFCYTCSSEMTVNHYCMKCKR